jgi:hypothetical protein
MHSEPYKTFVNLQKKISLNENDISLMVICKQARLFEHTYILQDRFIEECIFIKHISDIAYQDRITILINRFHI